MLNTGLLSIAVVFLLLLGAAILDTNKIISRRSDGSDELKPLPLLFVIIPVICIIASYFTR